MRKLLLMFVMLLGSVATMQAQSNTTFDFSCAEPAELFTEAQQEVLGDNEFEVNSDPVAAAAGIWTVDLLGQYSDEDTQADIRIVDGEFVVEVQGEGRDGQATFAVLEDAITFAETFNYTSTSFAGYQRARMVAAGFAQGRERNDDGSYYPLPNHYVDQFQLSSGSYGKVVIDFVNLSEFQFLTTTTHSTGIDEVEYRTFEAALAGAIASRDSLTN